ncbi:hypothetical protein GTP58_09490 [Duganella sp. CY15W]|uniref:hypothetical protein n=1 Tax=Duganella sp. CY15W TaxID=2692172 RepID=UPI00136A5F7A|nr:hypothetical protein [Duganella sp. CY15W]MYM28555.1 hypothetical protein [Duganella sp. CY15W]
MTRQIIAKIDQQGSVVAGKGLHSDYKSNIYVVEFDTGIFKSTPVIIATTDTSSLGGTYTCSASVHDAGYAGCKISVQNLNGQDVKAAINLFVSEAV